VEIAFQLASGFWVNQEFVVLRDFGTGIILGLPFLCALGAQIFVTRGLVNTKLGFLPMVYGHTVQQANDGLLVSAGKMGEEVEVFNMELDSRVSCPNLKKQIEEQMSNSLSVEQRIQVKNLLFEYRMLWEGNRRGLAIETAHDIRLTTSRPLSTRPRRFSMEQQQIIEKEVEEMELAGVIEDSTSPFASDVVLVRKATGEWRVCIDFRTLNNFTVMDSFPLPPMQDLLRNIKESSWFVTLDLRSGYWQIPMVASAKPLTAFRTPRGLKQFIVMPFGLKTAPATFQRMMNELLEDLYWKGVLVYLDDVLVHGKTFEMVFERLTEVFRRLARANLTLRLDKCNLFVRRVKYLGYIVEEGLLRPNVAKVEALKKAVCPKNVRGVRSLLGLLGFYRQFIHHFSSKAEPLTRLLKKGVPFVWEAEQEAAMKSLIEGLADRVLANPGVEEKLKLETDASDIALGAILSCSKDGINWRPVEFASKTFCGTQQRWPVHEREAFAIVWSLNKFDCYLRGRSFQVFTDNSSLQWMAKATTGKIARWAARMAEYSMEIKHKSGKQMEHVDFLSRYVQEDEAGLEDRMTVWMAGNDVEVSEVPTVEDVVAAQKVELPRWGKGFASRDGVIFFRSKFYVPPGLRSRVLAAGHKLNPLSHSGMRKTKAIISKVFRWPAMDGDISKYIQGCLACQRVRPGIESL